MVKKWIVAVTSMALLAGAADATRTFNFSYLLLHGGFIYGNVNFTTGDKVIDVDGHSALSVTSISGDEGGVAITGLVPSFPQQYGGADNYLFPDLFPPVSSLGVSFSFADGHYGNFFYDEEDTYYKIFEFTATNLAGDEETDTLRILNPTFIETTAAVPEPASWVLMLSGFGAIGGAMRRRCLSRA